MNRNELGRFTPSKNTFTIVDDIVYCFDENGELLFFTDDKRVIEYHWGRYANGYYCGSINGKIIPIHRFVSNPKDDELVDHINRNKKDNRKSNLRNTNKGVNAFNCDVRKNNTSGVTGVWYRKDTKRWASEIKVNGKKVSLGCFPTFEQAVKARKEGESKYYGDK